MILVTADLHLSENPRDDYRFAFQKQLRALVKKLKVEVVIICGDLTEEKDHHGAWLVNRTVDAMARLAKLCRVVIIRGNHDYVDLASPFYEFLQRIPGISWVNDAMTAEDLPIPLLAGLGRVLFLPHGAPIPKGQFDWVFTHQTFQGAHVGHGMQMRGLPLDTFGKATVISGDIHVPQVLNTKGKSWVEYVGAPYLVDFGDNYKPRVITLRDRSRELGRKGAWTVGTHPVKGPQKRLVEIGCVNDILHGSTATRHCNRGDILKVRMSLTAKEKDDWPNIREQIRAACDEHGFILWSVHPVLIDSLRGTNKKKKRAHKYEVKSDAAIFEAYVKARKIDTAKAKTGRLLLRKI